MSPSYPFPKYDILGAGIHAAPMSQARDVIDDAIRDQRRLMIGVVIAGRSNGYFGDEEEEANANDIAASNADVLFVAITSPKKERFMARWGSTINTKVVHGVGGSFDVVAGFVERAPESWQKLGLEWLYRVKQEPGRLWKRYLVTNLKFIGRVMLDLVLRR